MERICLLAGIEDRAAAQEVDILVPDGTLQEKEVVTGHYFETDFSVIIPSPDIFEGDDDGTETPTDGTSNTINVGADSTSTGFTNAAGAPTGTQTQATTSATLQGPQFRGAGRSETLDAGGGAFHFAGLMTQPIEQLATSVGRKYQTAYTRGTVDTQTSDLKTSPSRMVRPGKSPIQMTPGSP